MADEDYFEIKYWPGADYHARFIYEGPDGEQIDVTTGYTGSLMIYANDTLVDTVESEQSEGVFHVHATWEDTAGWPGSTDFKLEIIQDLATDEKKIIAFGAMTERRRFGQ